eukprot:gene39489-11926_t
MRWGSHRRDASRAAKKRRCRSQSPGKLQPRPGSPLLPPSTAAQQQPKD